ncbi:MAG: glycosyltransferase [SAR324 cluster bacterium]|nr:glycosyltransferase [SAR324 cluster bacterium]
MNIAIILPAFNEEHTIAKVITSFHKELPKAKIVVVNNASTDNTFNEATKTFAKLDIGGTIINEARQGKGFAVRAAFTQIDADYYVLCDADDTYPANSVKDLLNLAYEGADLVVGNRLSSGSYKKQNNRRYHTFGNRLINFIVNCLFSNIDKIKDVMSGYRVFSRKFVKNYPILVPGFQLETDMTLHALDKRFVVREMEVTYQNRPKESFSKLNTISDGLKVLFCIARVFRYYRPLFFFSILSLIFLITGFLSAIPVLRDWILYSYIYHVPLAILASSLELVAILTLLAGFILDSLSHQNKFMYEHTLLNLKKD